MKRFSITLYIVLAGLAFAPALAPALAAAQTGGSNPSFPSGGSGNTAPSGGSGNSLFQLENPLGNGVNSFCTLIKTLLQVIILLGIPVATFFVVYAGFRLVLARGNPTALEKARRNLYYTVIGIAVFLGAWLLAQVISNTIAALGIKILGSCTQ